MAVHESVASFNAALEEFVETLPEEVVLPAVQRVAMDVLSRVVLRSPVDTGRFRGNWTVSVNARDFTFTEEVDPSGQRTIAEGQAVIQGTVELPTAIYIQNNVPYAARIENGWSQQAPAGVVAVTLAEVEAGLARR